MSQDLARSTHEHRFCYGQLKSFEQRFRANRGPNLGFGRAAHWSETPRSGAKWSETEEAELVQHFRDLVPENGTMMSFKQLCELAWHHGRTAASIRRVRSMCCLAKQEVWKRLAASHSDGLNTSKHTRFP